MLDRIVRAIDSNRFVFYFVNVLVAAIWGYFAYTRGYEALGDYRKLCAENAAEPDRRYVLVYLLVIASNGLLVLFYVTRRRSTDLGTDPLSVILAHLGTWLTLILQLERFKAGPPAHRALSGPCTIVMIAAFAVMTLGFASLGRSWGIIPANRGIKRGGLYRLVRHPIYAAYVIFYANNALLRVNEGTVAVAFILPLLLYGRATLEERVLRRDPEYLAYAEKTRYMFFPGLL